MFSKEYGEILGALRETGALLIFPKGALIHHPPMAGGGIPPVGRDRVLSEGDTAPAGAVENAAI